MNAFIVCVNYMEELTLSLPYNRHHYDGVCLITDEACAEAVTEIAMHNQACVVITDLFYAYGASFNKWRPLDMVLQNIATMTGGWICVQDADVLWPKEASLPKVQGHLYSPYRRMYPTVPDEAPPEFEWLNYPRHRNVGEFAGYTQVFHSDDPVLRRCAMCGNFRKDHPLDHCREFHWFQVDWVHAGGADSIFQRRWMDHDKVRPGWECLHLGEAGSNWFGRAAPLKDGTVLPGSAERRRRYTEIWPQRRKERDPYFHSERTARAD